MNFHVASRGGGVTFNLGFPAGGGGRVMFKLSNNFF